MLMLVEQVQAEVFRYLYVLSMACSRAGLRAGALATLVVTFALAALLLRSARHRRPNVTIEGREAHDRAA
jgi:hypothetical protein